MYTVDITKTRDHNEFEQIAVFKKDDLPPGWYSTHTEAMASILSRAFGIEFVRLLDPDDEYDYALFRYSGAD